MSDIIPIFYIGISLGLLIGFGEMVYLAHQQGGDWLEAFEAVLKRFTGV